MDLFTSRNPDQLYSIRRFPACCALTAGTLGATAPVMHKLSKIEIVSCELSDRYCGSFDAWKDVDYALIWIWAMSKEANAYGGYTKVQVLLTWEDGTRYGVRVDIGDDAPLIAPYVRADCERIACRRIPSGTNRKDWLAFVARYPELQELASRILDTCELP